MMRPTTFALALSLLALTPLTAWADDSTLSAQQIIDKATARNSLGGFRAGTAQLTLAVTSRNGSTKTKKLDVRSKKLDSKLHTRIRLTAPKGLKGQTFLFVENSSSGGEDDVWLYLPVFSATRRIAGSQKRGAFLGSHMTYRDLESRDAKDGVLKRLADASIGKSKVYVIEAKPKAGSTATDYGKVEVYVRKRDFVPLKVKYFDKAGKEVIKTMFAEKLGKTKKGETYIKRMSVRVAKGGATVLTIDSLDESADLPATLFSKDRLAN